MSSDSILALRATGQFPLSVASSLAMEAACGIHPEIQAPKAPLLGYGALWINVRTLFRNLMGSMSREDAHAVLPIPIARALVEEMNHIEQIVKDHSPRTQVQFYASNYRDLAHRYPRALIRVDNTDRQKEYTAIQTEVIAWLLTDQPGRIKGFDLKLKPTTPAKTLILTHYAFDLCSAKAFGGLDLLESHTGAIKTKSQWYTKYHDGKALTMMPFREDLLQIFGDTELFRPYEITVRKELMEVAHKLRWTPLTTYDMIVYGVDHLKNHYFRAILREIIKP